MRKTVVGFKDKVIRLFKTNTPKQRVYGRGNKLTKQKHKNNLKKMMIIINQKE